MGNPGKILIAHLLSKPEERRERASVRSVSRLAKHGLQYLPMVNPPYDRRPPVETAVDPARVSEVCGANRLGPGHYGGYLAHRQVFCQVPELEQFDAVLVFECDSALTLAPKAFAGLLQRSLEWMESADAAYLTFGGAHPGMKVRRTLNSRYQEVTETYWAHCYLVPRRYFALYRQRFESLPWDTIDCWYNTALKDQSRYVYDTALCVQLSGMSIIDRMSKRKPSVLSWRIRNLSRRLRQRWFGAAHDSQAPPTAQAPQIPQI